MFVSSALAASIAAGNRSDARRSQISGGILHTSAREYEAQLSVRARALCTVLLRERGVFALREPLVDDVSHIKDYDRTLGVHDVHLHESLRLASLVAVDGALTERIVRVQVVRDVYHTSFTVGWYWDPGTCYMHERDALRQLVNMVVELMEPTNDSSRNAQWRQQAVQWRVETQVVHYAEPLDANGKPLKSVEETLFDRSRSKQPSLYPITSVTRAKRLQAMRSANNTSSGLRVTMHCLVVQVEQLSEPDALLASAVAPPIQIPQIPPPPPPSRWRPPTPRTPRLQAPSQTARQELQDKIKLWLQRRQQQQKQQLALKQQQDALKQQQAALKQQQTAPQKLNETTAQYISRLIQEGIWNISPKSTKNLLPQSPKSPLSSSSGGGGGSGTNEEDDDAFLQTSPNRIPPVVIPTTTTTTTTTTPTTTTTTTTTTASTTANTGITGDNDDFHSGDVPLPTIPNTNVNIAIPVKTELPDDTSESDVMKSADENQEEEKDNDEEEEKDEDEEENVDVQQEYRDIRDRWSLQVQAQTTLRVVDVRERFGHIDNPEVFVGAVEAAKVTVYDDALQAYSQELTDVPLRMFRTVHPRKIDSIVHALPIIEETQRLQRVVGNLPRLLNILSDVTHMIASDKNTNEITQPIAFGYNDQQYYTCPFVFDLVYSMLFSTYVKEPLDSLFCTILSQSVVENQFTSEFMRRYERDTEMYRDDPNSISIANFRTLLLDANLNMQQFQMQVAEKISESFCVSDKKFKEFVDSLDSDEHPEITEPFEYPTEIFRRRSPPENIFETVSIADKIMVSTKNMRPSPSKMRARSVETDRKVVNEYIQEVVLALREVALFKVASFVKNDSKYIGDDAKLWKNLKLFRRVNSRTISVEEKSAVLRTLAEHKSALAKDNEPLYLANKNKSRMYYLMNLVNYLIFITQPSRLTHIVNEHFSVDKLMSQLGSQTLDVSVEMSIEDYYRLHISLVSRFYVIQLVRTHYVMRQAMRAFAFLISEADERQFGLFNQDFQTTIENVMVKALAQFDQILYDNQPTDTSDKWVGVAFATNWLQGVFCISEMYSSDQLGMIVQELMQDASLSQGVVDFLTYDRISPLLLLQDIDLSSVLGEKSSASSSSGSISSVTDDEFLL